MAKTTDYFTKRTLAAWDEAAPRHAAINASLAVNIANKNFNNLNPDFNALVDELGVVNKSIVQICCNNGIDLISIKNKGAGRCLGIDGSKAFIGQAMSLANSAGYPDMEFCHSDIFDLSEKYQHSFDIAIITVGVFNWIPDLPRFMEICASLLCAGGYLLIEEKHPILWMYQEGEPSYIHYSYFDTEPVKEMNGLDYFTHQKYAAKESYSFHHSFAEICMSAIASNLTLEYVKELPYNVGNYCADLENIENNPPLGINMRLKKLI